MVKSRRVPGSSGYPPMDFDIGQLKVFIEVVEQRSFSRAARALGLVQASVSERISTLERGVGVRLLDRLGRKVTPTQAGEILLLRARELLALRDKAAMELKQLLGVEKGRVSIGGSTTPGEYIIPIILKKFGKRFPGIFVRLLIGDTEEVVERVESGALEMAVVGSRQRSEHLSCSPVWNDRIVPIVSASHRWGRKRRPVAMAELKQEPLILRERGSATRAITEHHLFAALGGSIGDFSSVIELGSATAVKEGVKAGLGAALVSEWAVKSEINSGVLKMFSIEGVSIERKLYLVHDKRRELSPAARAMDNFIADEVRRRK